MAEPFVGEIRSFAFGIIPKGWMLCNGALLPVKTNQALFAVIGATYGGDGTTTFALPNLQGRTPIGANAQFKLGVAGGEETHVLTVSEMPQHTHTAAGSSITASAVTPAGNVWAKTSPNSYNSSANVTMSPDAISSTGSSAAHSNMQPYLALSYCIAITGIFPSKH
jgi:microcystin-dependent protein